MWIWDFSEGRAGGQAGEQDARDQHDAEQPQQDLGPGDACQEEDEPEAKCQDPHSSPVIWHNWGC